MDNPVFEQGKNYKVSFGAINEENGVRLILKMNDKVIFNFLDDEENCILNDGYFGVLAVDGTMNLEIG